MAEVERAVDLLGRGTADITLMHCTVQYPANDEYLNMRALATMAASFPNQTIGYSDHTEGHVAGMLAVALGATWLEKHFTLDNTMEGPDHHFSTDPETMKRYVRAVRRTETMLGSAVKEPVGPEWNIRVTGRRYLTTVMDIESGDVFGANSIMPRRVDTSRVDPAFLLVSDQMERVIGSRAARDLVAGTAVTMADLDLATPEGDG